MNKNYITWLKSENKSEKTIRNYTTYVQEFLNSVGKDERDITINDLDNWKLSITHCAPSYVAIKVNSVKSYFNYLKRIGEITENPTIELKTPVVRPKVDIYIESNEITRLINATTSKQSRAIIAILATTGLRMEEMSSITIAQWNKMKRDKTRNITILGKGAKERSIYINDIAMRYIDEYIESRRKANTMYLFETTGNKQMDNSNLNKMLKNSARKAGLPYAEEITLHKLRKAFATIANANGVDTPTISAALGHSSLAVTTRYIQTKQSMINNAMANIRF